MLSTAPSTARRWLRENECLRNKCSSRRIPSKPCGRKEIMSACMRCGRELTHNEIGAHKKFINRGSTEFLCRDCLAEKLGVPAELIDRKIEEFKKQGCTLFV